MKYPELYTCLIPKKLETSIDYSFHGLKHVHNFKKSIKLNEQGNNILVN